jgi:deazaflavin-dependent oxidoreductase (nitroreductase family)
MPDSADEAIRAGAHPAKKRTEGFFKPVDYSCRSTYRRPANLYLRFQWLAHMLTALGAVPSYVVTLEVPGRRSGVVRRTTLVRTSSGGAEYLVALSGESEWVRNVRAANGRVVIGRRERRSATLVEVPPPERASVIRSYLFRAGRIPGSKGAVKEARYYFGLTSNPSLEEIEKVADYYPVFRVEK